MTRPARLNGTARDLLCLAAAAGLLFFVALGARDLWNPNESIYGQAVVEMTERADWRIPTVNGKVFAEKPILYFWSARLVSLMSGSVNEFSLRVPSAIAGVVSVLLTYLLVLAYAGRRRALIAAALFATLYQVFWAARSVQMDILVLTTTLGVLLPLTRMLDFGMRPSKAWALAGLAAGVGFIAKGPVTWILPGLIVIGYAVSQRKLNILRNRSIVIGASVALAIGAPWYVTLWLGGNTEFLREVLIRQNFSRFVEAWDHDNPWWYYFTYVWTDYAPWSFLLPAALLNRGVSDGERKLDRMSWVWIASVVVFFSLAESKRAPYILPIAPAVASLAAGVADRWMKQSFQRRRARMTAGGGFGALVVAILAGGIYMLLSRSEIPRELQDISVVFGICMVMSGTALATGLAVFREHPRFVPVVLYAAIVAAYLAAAVWILPAADPLKSERDFTTAMNQELRAEGSSIVSYRLWDWRAGYSYYSRRTIPNLKAPAQLRTYWRANELAYVLVEDEHRAELQALIPEATLVRQQRIGGRTASLFAKRQRHPPFPDTPGQQASERFSAPAKDFEQGFHVPNASGQ